MTVLVQVLQPPHGIVLVAAKSFYYGVGGGTDRFTELVRTDGILECKQVNLLLSLGYSFGRCDPGTPTAVDEARALANNWGSALAAASCAQSVDTAASSSIMHSISNSLGW